jgi:glyoxylase-like metal-dependent hydrolase (beta-lactamase superfamily II)
VTITRFTRFRFVNAYFVEEEDGLTLVDTTMNAADRLLAEAGLLGAPIRRIALTHGHGDHVGSLDALKQQLGDAVEVSMSELDAQIHAGEREKTKGSWPKLETRPDVRLAAGDRVGSLEVIATPGHTPGHVSFLDPRDRSLIAGDVFTTYGGLKTTSEFNLRFPFAAMATEDKARNLESARALAELDVARVYVGHGPPVQGLQR